MMSNTTGIATDPSQLVDSGAREETRPFTALVDGLLQHAEQISQKLAILRDRIEGSMPPEAMAVAEGADPDGHRARLEKADTTLMRAESRLDNILVIME